MSVFFQRLDNEGRFSDSSHADHTPGEEVLGGYPAMGDFHNLLLFNITRPIQNHLVNGPVFKHNIIHGQNELYFHIASLPCWCVSGHVIRIWFGRQE